ncbi:ImmA/IrrE family metallo-endopeptidase [Nocardia sp. NPDC050175]|uniref:ImmA/IrrE family metallo-endopeptidase n=1 Tax=Nocardia sp. NPDC050175 TaxID=3364317 RepID=UPI0037962C31
MPALFGAYLANSGCDSGVLVNSRLTRAVRRQTSAHELGHHRLGHSTSVDIGLGEDPSLDMSTAARQWSPDEKAAESFAAWFLMPRRAVLTTMAELGMERIASASQVYQLALHLGTSYAAAVRQLVSLRLIPAADAQTWSRIPPSKFKRHLAGDLLGTTRDMDVWHLDRGQQRVLYTSPDDLLVVPAPALVREICGLVEMAGEDSHSTVLRCGTPSEGPQTATIDTTGGLITVVVEPRPQGIDPSALPVPTLTGNM